MRVTNIDILSVKLNKIFKNETNSINNRYSWTIGFTFG